MKRIFSIVLLMCLFFTLPLMTARAEEPDAGISAGDDSVTVPVESSGATSGETEDALPEDTDDAGGDSSGDTQDAGTDEAPGDTENETNGNANSGSEDFDQDGGGTDSPIQGIVRILVTNESGSPLSGAVFGIYDAANHDKMAEITSGSDGTVPEGAYYLKQLAAAAGYAPLGDAVSFSISEKGQVFSQTIVNRAGYGTLRATVSGPDGEPLRGAALAVYRQADYTLAAEITTGSDGAAETGLPVGSYYLTQTRTLTGYVLPAASVSFALTTDGETAELAIVNQKEAAAEPAGALRLIKTDANTGTRLNGAVFGVYRASDDKKLAEITTDSSGAATVALDAGSYYLLELAAPDGYTLSTEKSPFVVQAGETKEITVTNTPKQPETGTLRLIKADAETGARLNGAVFGVYRASDDKKLTEITTGGNGTATVEQEAGSYYLLEQTAPDGYILSTDKASFVIKAGETKEITITNAPKPPETGTLRLVKTDADTGVRLNGAVFSVYRASDNVKMAEVSTDSGGMATVALEAGSYYLLEQTAPDGYTLSPDKTSFVIKAGETKEVTIANTAVVSAADALAGTLQLVKKAEATGKPLSGVVFGIYDAAGNTKVVEITSGSDGMAVYTLPEGRYYLRELQAPAGYALETARILFTVRAGNSVKVEVTNMLESGAKGSVVQGQSVQGSAGGPSTSGAGGITIPKTGEAFPVLNYLLAALCLGAAAACGAVLYRKYGRKKRGN